MATPIYTIQNCFSFNIPLSSAITYIGYDYNSLELFVKFQTDTIYCYPDMMYDEFLFLVQAPSVGKCWNEMLKQVPQLRSYRVISDDYAAFLIRISERIVADARKVHYCLL